MTRGVKVADGGCLLGGGAQEISVMQLAVDCDDWILARSEGARGLGRVGAMDVASVLLLPVQGRMGEPW